MNAACSKRVAQSSPAQRPLNAGDWSVRYGREDEVLRRERDYYKTLADSYLRRNAQLAVYLSNLIDLFDADDPHMDPATATALKAASAVLKADESAACHKS